MKEGHFKDDYGCPYVKTVNMKIFGGKRSITCDKVEAFFGTVKLNSQVSRTVFVGIDDQSLAYLFQIAFWNYETFEDFTYGVTTLKELISSKKTLMGIDIKEYLEAYGSTKSSEICETMEKAFLELGFATKARDFTHACLVSFEPHFIYSNFVNRIILSCSIPMYSENFVPVKISRNDWKKGKNEIDGIVGNPLWHVDSTTHDMNLKIFKLSHKKDLGVMVPFQTTHVYKGKNIQLVIYNKNSHNINRVPIYWNEQPIMNYVFGVLEVISKAKKKEIAFMTGFGQLKEDLNSKWPSLRHKKYVFKEWVSCFRKLGFNHYQDALKLILDKSKNVQKLYSNLHSFVVNDFHDCGQLTEVMFSRLYFNFVQQQKEKEKYPEFQSILSKKFPIKWIVKQEVDGIKLESDISFEKIVLSQKEEERSSDVIEVEVEEDDD